MPAGRYIVRFSSQPAPWTLKSAMLNGRDIADVPVTLDAADLSGLVVTFTDRPATIAGSIRAFSTTGLPAGEYFVVGINSAQTVNWQGPAFWQRLSRVATRTMLADGQSLSLTLTTVDGIVR